ncbi:MAG: hypothetical protein GY915_05685 [bacterium]|nr:hypothetical protein [bacterium]
MMKNFLRYFIIIFMGLNVQPASASFEDDLDWGAALKLIEESSKIGDADPSTVLKSLAETHGVSGVLDANEYGLLNDFVSSEIVSLGAAAFIVDANEVLNETQVLVVSGVGFPTTVTILEQPQEEYSVKDCLNAFFTEKFENLAQCFAAQTVEELSLASGLDIDTLEGSKFALAKRQYKWLKDQFLRTSKVDEQNDCAIGAICVMGLLPQSSPHMFFDTQWTSWNGVLPRLQEVIGGLAQHPDDLVRPSLEVAEELEILGNGVITVKELLNTDLDSIDDSGSWNRWLANVWINQKLELSDFVLQSELKPQARLFLVNFKLILKLFFAENMAKQMKMDWDTFDSVRGDIMGTLKGTLSKLPKEFEPESLLQIKGPTISEYLSNAEGLDPAVKKSLSAVSIETNKPGWLGMVHYIWNVYNQL